MSPDEAAVIVRDAEEAAAVPHPGHALPATTTRSRKRTPRRASSPSTIVPSTTTSQGEHRPSTIDHRASLLRVSRAPRLALATRRCSRRAHDTPPPRGPGHLHFSTGIRFSIDIVVLDDQWAIGAIFRICNPPSRTKNCCKTYTLIKFFSFWTQPQRIRLYQLTNSCFDFLGTF